MQIPYIERGPCEHVSVPLQNSPSSQSSLFTQKQPDMNNRDNKTIKADRVNFEFFITKCSSVAC
jgi:hypothetical protein